MAKPYDNHLKIAKRVIRYLEGTIDFGIEYNNDLNLKLTSYSNSDWVGDLNDRKYTIEYAFSI